MDIMDTVEEFLLVEKMKQTGAAELAKVFEIEFTDRGDPIPDGYCQCGAEMMAGEIVHGNSGPYRVWRCPECGHEAHQPL